MPIVVLLLLEHTLLPSCNLLAQSHSAAIAVGIRQDLGNIARSRAYNEKLFDGAQKEQVLREVSEYQGEEQLQTALEASIVTQKVPQGIDLAQVSVLHEAQRHVNDTEDGPVSLACIDVATLYSGHAA